MKKKLSAVIFVASLLLLWQILYDLDIWPDIIFPSLPSIGTALLKSFTVDSILYMVIYSLRLIFKGMLWGTILAFIFSSLSILNDVIDFLYGMVTSLFDLIPGVALLPLVILWVGVGENAILVIVVHSIIWPVSRSIITGFKTVPKLYIEVGKNLGMSKFQLVREVYLPAAMSSIISGLRTGWARAWRGFISTEMIFGTTNGGAGIGWYIMKKRMNVDVAGVFASIIVIVLIGIIVEYAGFQTWEKLTVRKWGTSR